MAVLYSLAAITPDTEFGLSFYDYFTEEERFACGAWPACGNTCPK